MAKTININDFDYPLPDERIAKFPLERRDSSKLLVYRNGTISERHFSDIGDELSSDTLFVFNNTKVVRARLVMHKPSGARVEVFCLEPHAPADYERAFAVRGECSWSCIVGNLKKWKEGAVQIPFQYEGSDYLLEAYIDERGTREHIVRFVWDAPLTFGQLLEVLGRIPIPPYLNRESEEIDNTRYQTVYSRFEGSVAAPTAGLHFTNELIESLKQRGFSFGEVTLHVGAGTFLPVKDEDATKHAMHTEHFSINLQTLELLGKKMGNITAVGTTSVRTLESLYWFGVKLQYNPLLEEMHILQWEPYELADKGDVPLKQSLQNVLAFMQRLGVDNLYGDTQLMIAPGYKYHVVSGIITNFHQPKSTLLLLVSALIGDVWKEGYNYALSHDFRFLSYGDSCLFVP